MWIQYDGGDGFLKTENVKTGKAMRLIQSGKAELAAEPSLEPKNEHKSDLGNGRKANSRSDVAGSDRGKPKRA